MPDKREISEILESVRKENREILTEHESKKILSHWDVPVTRTILTTDKLEAVNAARELKYPVVMKVLSPDISNRSQIGAVNVGLTSEIEVRQAYEDILMNARSYDENAEIQGVAVQKYVPDAQKVVMGIIQDQSFGPTVMFSLGGVWFDVLKDISFRLAPVSTGDAEDMIKEINGYPVLSNVGGRPPLDIGALVDMLRKISRLPAEFEEIYEADLNPVFVFGEGGGAKAIDARITIKRIDENSD